MLRRAFMLFALALTALFIFAVPAFAADAAPGDGSGLGTALGVVAAIGVPLAVVKVINVAKALVDGDRRDAALTVLSWIVAFGVLALYAQTRFAQGVDVGGFDLDDADLLELLVLGLSYGSTASVGFDVLAKRAA